MPKSTKKIRNIYMDYASSAEPNPGSIHLRGVQAKKILERARVDVAGVLGAGSSEVIFTSGGTESNNLAIQGCVFFWQGRELPHIITTNIEHPSVLETCKLLQNRKIAEVTIVPVETNGIVDPEKIKKAIKKNTVLVSVMYANNEIGTIQPIREIARVIRQYRKGKAGVVLSVIRTPSWKGKNHLAAAKIPPSTTPAFPFFHTDAVQAANYLDLNVEKLGVDMLSLSGSKIPGAGKAGVLYKRRTAPLANVFGGGDQEMGLRPGTESVGEIAKFSKALLSVQSVREKESKRLGKLRDYFFEKLSHSNILTNFRMIINGDLENRLPNNLNITIPGIPSDLLVIELSARGIMVSAKSACKAGDGKVSHVIKAVNKNIKETDGSLRFSFGPDTKKSDIDLTVRAISQILLKLKKWYT